MDNVHTVIRRRSMRFTDIIAVLRFPYGHRTTHLNLRTVRTIYGRLATLVAGAQVLLVTGGHMALALSHPISDSGIVMFKYYVHTYVHM
jgi:hypothetical protein